MSAGLDGGARMTRGARTADEAKAEGDLAPVTYNYAFFHLIFALASTYIAMLMTGVGPSLQKNPPKENVQQGSIGFRRFAR